MASKVAILRLKMLAALMLLVNLLCVSSFAGSNIEPVPGPVEALVLKVIDGDTLVARARIWLGQVVDISVRINGIDAPELKGKCDKERLLARRAKDFVSATADGSHVMLFDIQYGKYAGRVVADVQTADGKNLGASLIAAGLARAYQGGRRLSWCDD